MKNTVILFFVMVSAVWPQCKLVMNPDTGLLDCGGGGGNGAGGGTIYPNVTNSLVSSGTQLDLTHTFSAEAAAAAVIDCYTPAKVKIPGTTPTITISNPTATTIRVTFGASQAAGTSCNANATGTGLQGPAGPQGPEGPPGSGGGSGDVTGPGSSVSGNLPSFSGTTGKVIQDSGVSGSSVAGHISSTLNPHNVTKTQVGLGSVPDVDATARSTHTGTQLAATISDFNAAVGATNAGTASMLATNGANCAVNQAAGGVNTSGAAEDCINLPALYQPLDTDLTALAALTATTGLIARTGAGAFAVRSILGTTNQISVVNGDGAGSNPTISIPTSPTLPGITTGTFSGNLTGSVTGNASTATALAANPANCPGGQAPLGVDASGAVEGCFTPAGGGGSGDVVGPASSVSGNLTSFSGTTGKLIQDSGILGSSVSGHISSTANPHSVTKTQVGLGNVPNTDATLRANHTGTQLAATISDFNTAVGLTNAGTATALAANGANCSAGQAPLGVDASGAVEGCFTPGGGGNALTSQPLSQFAPTTSAELAGVLTNESGTGLFVLQTSPTIITPTIASFASATHNHTNAAGGGQITDAALSAAVTVAKGGTGFTSGTSGGIPYFVTGTGMASSLALTTGLPVIGGGAGGAPSVGTRSGNTTQYVTTLGTQTSGRCVEIDANGNHIAAAAACGSGAGHTQNTDTGTTSTTFHLDSDGTGPKLVNESGALTIRTAADVVMASISTAGVLSLGDGTSPWNLTGLTDSTAPGAPATSNEFTAYVDRADGLFKWHLNGQGSPYVAVRTADPVFTGSVQIPNGTAPTVDAAGEIAVDTTTEQIQFYGAAKRALPAIQSMSFVIPAPAAADDINLMKVPYGMTIVGIDAIVQGTTSATGQLQECTSAGATCTDLDADIVADADGAADDGTLTDSAIASGAWLRWKTTSVSGTPTFLTVTVRYRVTPD